MAKLLLYKFKYENLFIQHLIRPMIISKQTQNSLSIVQHGKHKMKILSP